jgi:hypothetical protein
MISFSFGRNLGESGDGSLGTDGSGNILSVYAAKVKPSCEAISRASQGVLLSARSKRPRSRMSQVRNEFFRAQRSFRVRVLPHRGLVAGRLSRCEV